MVEVLVRTGIIKTKSLYEAFRRVRRHTFLPGTPLERVYNLHEAVPVQFGARGVPTSSSSAPDIMAIMAEQLVVAPRQRIMEIGTGTGYNAAVLASAVGPGGSVVSLDIDVALATRARDNLKRGRHEGVSVVAADGWLGMPGGAPFDRIEATVAVQDISRRWVEQLREGGVLVAPLGLRAGIQASVAFEKKGRSLSSISLQGCGFMPLRGANAGPATQVALQGWIVGASELTEAEVALLDDLMRGEPKRRPAPQLVEGWFTRLAFEAEGAVRLSSLDDFSRQLAGIYDPGAGGLAVVDGRWMLSWGCPETAERLLRLAESARPVELSRTRIEAEPTRDRVVAPAPGVLQRPEYTFFVDLG